MRSSPAFARTCYRAAVHAAPLQAPTTGRGTRRPGTQHEATGANAGLCLRWPRAVAGAGHRALYVALPLAHATTRGASARSRCAQGWFRVLGSPGNCSRGQRSSHRSGPHKGAAKARACRNLNHGHLKWMWVSYPPPINMNGSLPLLLGRYSIRQ